MLPEVGLQPTQTAPAAQVNGVGEANDVPALAIDAGAAVNSPHEPIASSNALDAGPRAAMIDSGQLASSAANSGPKAGGMPVACSCSAIDSCCDGCNMLLEATSSVFADPSTKYAWERESSVRDKWQEAYDHCQSLTTCGFDDWRLPTVDELRTLIRDCPSTQTQGACKLSNSCLRIECADSCKTCPNRENDHGKALYLLPALNNAPPSIWSAGLPPDDPNAAWALDNLTGSFYRQSRGANGGAICVRGK